MSDIELGDLKQEVIHAMQKPFIRLHGCNITKNTPTWKAWVKRNTRLWTNRLQSSVTYEISNEILDYLQPQVEKGNQSQLRKAILNAKPRHYNMWVEMDLEGISNVKRGLEAFWIESRSEFTVYDKNTGKVSKDHPQYKKAVLGDMFKIDHFYQPKDTDQKAGINPSLTDTDIWSEQGQIMPDRSSEDMPKTFKNLWFLGNADHEFSESLAPVMNRFSNRLNRFIDPQINQFQTFQKNNFQSLEPRKYARLMAILSLMNFDWFVQEPKDIGIQSLKLKKEITPFDSHHRVVLKLPKTKGRIINPKGPRRTEAYGVRRHEVAGHERNYRDAHGNIYKTIYINPHWRGDASLGTITKDYVVEKDDD